MDCPDGSVACLCTQPEVQGFIASCLKSSCPVRLYSKDIGLFNPDDRPRTLNQLLCTVSITVKPLSTAQLDPTRSLLRPLQAMLSLNPRPSQAPYPPLKPLNLRFLNRRHPRMRLVAAQPKLHCRLTRLLRGESQSVVLAK